MPYILRFLWKWQACLLCNETSNFPTAVLTQWANLLTTGHQKLFSCSFNSSFTKPLFNDHTWYISLITEQWRLTQQHIVVPSSCEAFVLMVQLWHHLRKPAEEFNVWHDLSIALCSHWRVPVSKFLPYSKRQVENRCIVEVLISPELCQIAAGPSWMLEIIWRILDYYPQIDSITKKSNPCSIYYAYKFSQGVFWKNQNSTECFPPHKHFLKDNLLLFYGIVTIHFHQIKRVILRND